MTGNTIVEECWAVHECLRRLGVQAADIYVHIGINIMVEARGDGGKTFLIDIGIPPNGREAFITEWKAFATKANAEAHLPESTGRYQAILDRSMPRRDTVGFMMAFLAKGFEVKNRDGSRKVNDGPRKVEETDQ